MYKQFAIDCEVNHRRLDLERALAAALRLASAPEDRGTLRWRSILSRFERGQVKSRLTIPWLPPAAPMATVTHAACAAATAD